MRKNIDIDFEYHDFEDYEDAHSLHGMSLPNNDMNDDSEIDEDEENYTFSHINELFKDWDFTEFAGDHKKAFKYINKKVDKNHKSKGKTLLKNIPVNHKGQLVGGGKKKMNKVIVPGDRAVIIEGVSKFMVDDSANSSWAKNIGKYKGKKLKELVFTFTNDSGQPFVIEMFNPSYPMDYLYSTGLNINNQVSVAGSTEVQYTDVLFDILANPTFIPNARLVISGPLASAQRNQSLIFTNKNIETKVKVNPANMAQSLDTMQFQSNIILFDILNGLNRPFVPDGMDVAEYTILPGNTVTFCWYYNQIQLKRFFFKEVRDSKTIVL